MLFTGFGLTQAVCQRHMTGASVPFTVLHSNSFKAVSCLERKHANYSHIAQFERLCSQDGAVKKLCYGRWECDELKYVPPLICVPWRRVNFFVGKKVSASLWSTAVCNVCYVCEGLIISNYDFVCVFLSNMLSFELILNSTYKTFWRNA